MTKFQMLVELDRMLMERLGQKERILQRGSVDYDDDWTDGYIDGLEYAMACISDMKNEVAA